MPLLEFHLGAYSNFSKIKTVFTLNFQTICNEISYENVKMYYIFSKILKKF